MKRIAAILAIITATAIMSVAQLPAKPDFAYPQTVLSDAEKAYADAMKNGDDIAALSALTCAAKANASIDENRMAHDYALLSESSQQFQSRPARALGTLYAACLLNDIFNRDRYKYNNRDLPDTPRPVNIDEWSGNMFRSVVDSLVRQAWKMRTSTPTSKIEPVISADNLTRKYYPTLTDCMASIIFDQLSYVVETKTLQDIKKEIIDGQTADSPAYYNWLMRLDELSDDYTSTGRITELLQQARNRGNLHNASVLWSYLDDEIDESLCDKLISLAQESLEICRGEWIENTISDILATLRRPRGEFATDRTFYAPEQPINVHIRKMANTDNVSVIAFDKEEYDNRGDMLPQPLAQCNVLCQPGDTTATATLKLPTGIYAVGVFANGASLKTAQSLHMQEITVTEGIPMAYVTDKRLDFFVLHTENGKPLADVHVQLLSSRDNKVLQHAITDTSGRVSFAPTQNARVALLYDDKQIIFDEHVPYLPDESPRPTNFIDIATDMAVYHPGDSVRYVVVLTQDGKTIANRHLKCVLNDSEDDQIATQTLVTDTFGRASGIVTIPEDVRTGTFSISAETDGLNSDYASFRVSDFKSAGYQFVDVVAYPQTPRKGLARITGKIANYAGQGIGNVSINVSVSPDTDSRNISDGTTETSADGSFAIDIPYPVNTVDATVFYDYTLTATAPDGETLLCNGSLNIYPYTISINVTGSGKYGPNKFNIAEPLTLSATVRDAGQNTVHKSMTWKLEDMATDNVVMHGEITDTENINAKKLAPGRYRMTVSLADSTLALPATNAYMYLFSLDSTALPAADRIFWTPEPQTINIDANGKAKITIGISEPGAFLTMLLGNEVCRASFFNPGYQTITFDVPNKNADNKLTINALRDGMVNSTTLTVKARQRQLKISVADSTDNTVEAGTNQTLRIRVLDSTGSPVQAAVCALAFNTRLNSVDKYLPLTITRPPLNYLQTYTSYPWRIQHTPYYKDFNIPQYTTLSTTYLYNPEWKYFPQIRRQIFGYRSPVHKKSVGSFADDSDMLCETLSESPKMANATGSTANRVVESKTKDVEESEGIEPLAPLNIRKGAAMQSLWLPDIVTDESGYAEIPWQVPGDNTSWQIVLTAWDKTTISTDTTFTRTAINPLALSLNAPHFLRRGDTARIAVDVRNNTDVPQHVRISTKCNNDLSGDTIVDIAANDHATVYNVFNTANFAMGINSLVVSAGATTRQYSDGEKLTIPILQSESTVVEARNFYLAGGDTTLRLDFEARPEADAVRTLSYTANPLWTVVESLGLPSVDNISPTATEYARAIFMLSTALGLEKEHSEIPLPQPRQSIKSSLDDLLLKLSRLQDPNGGFRWGEWSAKPSTYATIKVLSTAATLIRRGYAPKQLVQMCNKAVVFADANVSDTDLEYTLSRPAFDVTQSLSGRAVSDRSIQYALKNWRNMNIPAKAEAATMLWYNHQPNMARTIAESISQYGTLISGRGIEIRNLSTLSQYASVLDAMGTILPGSKATNGLREYLIVRKQGTLWGNNAVTANVISAMLADATLRPDPSVINPAISANGTEIASKTVGNKMAITDTLTVDKLSLDITKHAQSPAYGAVVTQFTQPTVHIEAFSDGDIEISKRLIAVRNGVPENVGQNQALRVGDVVRVQLVLKVHRPLSLVTVEDNRPAALVAVRQNSGYVNADGETAYREARTAVTKYYFDNLPRGTYLLEYECTAQFPGQFISGIAQATCAIAPSLTAHSSGTMLTVLP